MPKIKKVSASNKEDGYIEIKVEDKKGNVQKVDSKVFSDGRVRFSLTHPELNKKLPYDGIVEGSYLYLYPLIGVGILTDKPIRID